ncbi:hypothetical protein L249_6144 [Ophiocordyceps polyrhachis-furcata BCC 54312]|uniref:RNA polymerase II assembly factor Rtp1 C-terminal domain-containing protein n=1 Tax=Ophiocordyceps polyrhachis-furcata BCC 54312 TaxID=1330021 RepID=A0A367LJ37_9HYPO|nr:hypothetical protein L249_6144 [Ophiocordyceps polyrhachis-furcata BCC 54312]
MTIAEAPPTAAGGPDSNDARSSCNDYPMAENQTPVAPQPTIAQDIVNAATKAFNPTSTPESREAGLEEYNGIVAGAATWVLLPVLNSLIKPNLLPPWMREHLLQSLTLLPLRPDGVRSTLEFVFSVHPSGQGSDSAQPQKNGASITHEAVAVGTKLLSSVPPTMTPEAWFRAISGQLLDLLDGGAGKDLAKVVAQIVGFGILGQRQFGAPGAPGWEVFVQPLIEAVNPSLAPEKGRPVDAESDGEVTTLSLDRVIVPAQRLGTALHRLSVLVLSNSSPGLCRRMLKPIIVQLWALASWSQQAEAAEGRFISPARSLVQTYLQLFGKLDSISPIVDDLLCTGGDGPPHPPWCFRLTTDGKMESALRPQQSENVSLVWNEVEHKASVLVGIMASVCSSTDVGTVFLHYLDRWIQTAREQDRVQIKTVAQGHDSISAVRQLVEVTLLQRLMIQAPEKLVGHVQQLIEVICQVLVADGRSPVGDDVVSVVLSLLNLVITAPGFQRNKMGAEQTKTIEDALTRLGVEDRPEVSATAKNLGMLLRYRDELEGAGDGDATAKARHEEDEKTYRLAMSYINGDGDKPPPVVSEGINLLSKLMVAESPVLDIQAVAVLMSSLLKETDDFINLRVVKAFTLLANKHPKTTVQELLDGYLDAQEKWSTDVRLRFGEALAQVIERLGETFCGPVANQVCESLMSIAGRRGQRPKTMAKQAREERLQGLKRQRAEAMDEDEEEEAETTDRERENRAMLAQIVEGWEGKRGSEDVRMRASALSILGAALETNICGVEATVVSNAVELCVQVLTLERGPELGILRRAAVVGILSLVRALDRAREEKRQLGLVLTETGRAELQSRLSYVGETDEDGLVQQHARDAMESLESWREREREKETWTARLQMRAHGAAGSDLMQGRRPRIEEME